jgi:hypothetical protein
MHNLRTQLLKEYVQIISVHERAGTLVQQSIEFLIVDDQDLAPGQRNIFLKAQCHEIFFVYQ